MPDRMIKLSAEVKDAMTAVDLLTPVQMMDLVEYITTKVPYVETEIDVEKNKLHQAALRLRLLLIEMS